MTQVQAIGKAGVCTSWIVKKTLVKKLIGGKLEDCQTHIDNNPKWLQLKEVLQNIRGKGIATMIAKISSQDVVIKVQLSSDAKKEYDFQEKLFNDNGFIRYDCYFTCDGNKEYIESFSTMNEQTKICQNKGTSMGIIVMPYYKNGSLESSLNTKTKDELKTILKTIIQNYRNCYMKKHFTHGDLFCKNIVLSDKNAPIIIDFEKSSIGNKNKCDIFWNDLDNLCLDLSRHQDMGKLLDITRVLIINRAYRNEPSDIVMNDLMKAIDTI